TPASVEIVSSGVTLTNGLSRELPSDKLPGDLGRGPTPPGASFVGTRQPIPIARVEAGANAETTSSSFDDNETTVWSSDGHLNHGWIKYYFDREAKVSEVVLKLTGWRTQSYPVRIRVDDHIVFEGNTPRSLGYVTFSFAPVTGRNLKIELTGSAS